MATIEDGEQSDYRTFGMKNLLFRTYEPSEYSTFNPYNRYYSVHNYSVNDISTMLITYPSFWQVMFDWMYVLSRRDVANQKSA